MASFQWLQMRITEEKERREREAYILERLPRALDELQTNLADCVNSYTAEFGRASATLTKSGLTLRVVVRDSAPVEIEAKAEMPGFAIRGPGVNLEMEVGMLPGDRLFYRDRELDQYLSMEDLTRRILDRALFPKLKD